MMIEIATRGSRDLGPRVGTWVLLAVLAGPGCVEVDGGAVEVGWDLRYPDGRRTDDQDRFIDCQRARIGAMALSLRPTAGGPDPCEAEDRCRFACSHLGSGTTPFVIPEAEYAMELEVLDLEGRSLGSADGIVTPGPVVRQVRTGRIASLSVNLIIVDR